MPAVFTVTNNLDNGSVGSFRYELAHATSGSDTIAFDISGTGTVQTITLQDTLSVSTSVTIDATTEPGYAGSPLVDIMGNAGKANFDGLDVSAGNTTIRGLAINNFGGYGILLEQGGGDLIAGNYIGTNATGSSADANSSNGINVTDGSSNDTIGGVTAADRNVISGNTGDGIDFNGSSMSSTNLVEGNFIGLNAAGTTALPNDAAGVYIYGGATSITVGGTAAGAGNVISGNTTYGVEISDEGTSNIVVAGNYIGTNAAGSAAIGNGNTGVILENGTTDDMIGGAVVGARNLISGNGFTGDNSGVDIRGEGTSDNLVAGNYIGTDATGSFAIPNDDDGVALFFNASNDTIGGTATGAGNLISGNDFNGVELFDDAFENVVEGNAIGVNAAGTGALGNASFGVSISSNGEGEEEEGTADNIIGGTAPGAGNVIAYNSKGVVVTGVISTGDSILGNSIYNNAVIGIDLGNDGSTANTPGGAGSNSGPNDLQNYPQTTWARIDAGGDLLVNYFVDSNPGDPNDIPYPLHVEFFKADANGQGQVYLGADNFMATDFSNGGKVLNLGSAAALGIASGDNLVLTATDADGNTSEFSPTVPVADTIEVTNTNDSGVGSLRQAITDADADTNGGTNTITFAMSGPQTIAPVTCPADHHRIRRH